MPTWNGVEYPTWTVMPEGVAREFLAHNGHAPGRIDRLVAEQIQLGTMRPIGDAVKRIKKKQGELNPVSRFLNNTVRSSVGGYAGRDITMKKGELFGLELELEGRNLVNAKMPTCPGWRPHADGSLRGESSIEWIFNNPTTYNISVQRINRLFEGIKKSGAKIQNSYRTSTHVHLNYIDKYNYQVVNMFILYTILEDVLSRWCGEHRSGNLFCLGSRDAENIIRVMENCSLRYENFVEFNNELRYAGLNMSSLNKFGSIELRTMRGVDNAQEALDWLKIVNELYQFSLTNTKSPADIIESVSALGARGFIYDIFSNETANMLLEKFPENELHMSLYDGIRLIQMFAYTLSESWKIDVKYEKFDPKMEEDKEEPKVKTSDAFFRNGRLEFTTAVVDAPRQRARPIRDDIL